MTIRKTNPLRLLAVLTIMLALVPLHQAFAESTDQETGCTYTVQAGDTLGGIAKAFGLQIWELQVLNQEQYDIWNTLRPGWVLAVPCTQGSPAAAPEAQPPAAPTAAPAPATPSSASASAIPNSNLNIRSGPGATYGVVGTAFGGQEYAILGRNSDSSWVQIEGGWIAGWLAIIRGDLNAIPVTATSAPPPPSVPLPAPASPVPAPVASSSGFNLGGQTHSFANPGRMAEAGMSWVKFQHKWAPGQNPLELSGRIQAAHAAGFRVLFSMPGPEFPSSIDFASYTQFVKGVAAQGADAVEVWNEQNLDREWPAGQIDPNSYVNNMLAPIYAGVKSVNPNTLVISGAPAPTGFDNNFNVWADDRYIAGMRAAGASRYMDCVGVHFNAGATSPDATTGHPAAPGGGHYSWYFWPTYNLYAKTFTGKPVCFTEIGFLTSAGYGPLPQNFWWGGNTSIDQHAQWLGRAAQLARGTGNVRLFIVFNVDINYYAGDDPQGGYAIIRPDGGCPACGPLAAAIK